MSLGAGAEMFNSSIKLDEVKRLSEQISEVMHEGGEISVLECKVELRLMEKVSRCLNRMENRPDQIREVEAELMNLDEPTLGIAILQQPFLVRSDHTLDRVVDQLKRLAQSPDLKTEDLTIKALKEAANSEIDRLQNIGCKALFTSGRLSPEELYRFARSENLDFSYRIQSVQALLFSQSDKGPKAFLGIVNYWENEVANEQKSIYKNDLFELAKKMDYYQTLDRSKVEPIIELLFSAADAPGQSNEFKKIVQTSMAALPQFTIDYFQKLSLDQQMKASIVFTLGTCARRIPQATIALLDLAERSIKYKHDSWILNLIAQKLERAKHDGLLPRLESLIDFASENAYKPTDETFLNSLEIAKNYWITGQDQFKFIEYVKSLVKDFEEFPDLEEKDALQLRYRFERFHRQFRFSRATSGERDILFEAMIMTSESKPWVHSEAYLRINYDSLTETERLVVLDVCGHVAQGETNSLTQSQKLREILSFYRNIARNGTFAESQKGKHWLVKLTGEVLPE